MDKLGQNEPAFPQLKGEQIVTGQISSKYFDENGIEQTITQNVFGEVFHPGMSKRFYVACAAMQGRLTSRDSIRLGEFPLIIYQSYKLADELLRQENECTKNI